MFILNVTNGNALAVQTSNEVSQIFGWSSDDRYLAFAQVSPELPPESRRDGTYRNPTWVYVFDHADGSVARLTMNGAVLESAFVWLGASNCFVAVSPIGKDYTQKFVLDWPGGNRRQVYNYVTDFTLVSSNEAAFVSKSNIWECVLDSPKYPSVRQVSHFGTNLVEGIRWLRYDSHNREYYFCAYINGSNWRYFYHLENSGFRKLTSVDTYNGQLLEGESCFVCVENVSNRFTLAIHGPASDEHTNLFGGGGVISYAAAPRAGKVFAIGSTNNEPQAIWEYSLETKMLRRRVSGVDGKLASFSYAPIEEARFRASDGTMIPYFYLPAQRALAGGRKARLQPLVVYLPAPTWQFQAMFELQSQMFANLGYNYVAINYRGCDGYGRDYARQINSVLAADDILEILKELATTRAFDKRHVFLFSQSGGAEIVRQLLLTSPGTWTGAILDHPAGWPQMPGWQGDVFPPLEIFSGDQDRFLPSIEAMKRWANTNRLRVNINVQQQCGHQNWKMREARTIFRRMFEFCESAQQNE